MVRYLTPNSAQALRITRTDSTPSLCPAIRGNPRSFAQRPLPSMIIAICRGMFWGSSLDLHNLFFFARIEFINFGAAFIGQVLDFLVLSFLIILGKSFIVFLFPQVFIGLTPDIANGYFCVL